MHSKNKQIIFVKQNRKDMKNVYTTSAKYIIKPRIKKSWFRANRVVYDLILESKGERWHDPSYGNGDGNYVPFESSEVICTCDTLTEATSLKKKLKNK